MYRQLDVWLASEACGYNCTIRKFHLIFEQNYRPRRDSNSQSSDPKSDALSIRPRGHWGSLLQKMSYCVANKHPQIETSLLLVCAICRWFCGVVVITSALHAEGREFEPRQNLHFLDWWLMTWHHPKQPIFYIFMLCYTWLTLQKPILIHRICFSYDSVEKREGGNRSWTGDLSICSRMLCHWAIPPALLSRG